MLLFQISTFLSCFLFQGNPIAKPRDKRASKPRKVVKGRKTPIAGPAKGKMKPKGKKTKKKIISFHMTLCWLCTLESFHMNLCWLCTLECLLHVHCLCFFIQSMWGQLRLLYYITWAWPTVQSVLCTWHLFFSFLITCCPNLPLPAISSQLMSTHFEPFFVFQTVYSEPYIFFLTMRTQQWIWIKVCLKRARKKLICFVSDPRHLELWKWVAFTSSLIEFIHNYPPEIFSQLDFTNFCSSGFSLLSSVSLWCHAM